jgi:hypothetical protein
MNEEDEEFNRIEREAAMRKAAVMVAITKREWIGLTDEEIWKAVSRTGTSDSDVNPFQTIKDARAIENILRNKNT